MAIEYVEGDLLSSDEKVIVHGCNIRGGFDTGFAGVVRKRHPAALQAYMKHHQEKALVLGSVLWAFDGKLIGNAMTQPTYGRSGQHVSYDALRSCMLAVADAARWGVPGTPFADGFDAVSMPMIGSARGGGDWDVIETIISETLGDLKTRVYVLPGAKPSAAVLSARPRR